MALLQIVRDTVPSGVNCIYIRQPEALRLGHAVLCAASVIGESPFAVLLADDLLDGEERRFGDEADGRCIQLQPLLVLGVMDVPREQTRQYGIVSSERDEGEVRRVTHRGKPDPQRRLRRSPWSVATSSPDGSSSTCAISNPVPGASCNSPTRLRRCFREEAVLSYQFKGTRYDCGSKFGYLKATVGIRLAASETGAEFAAYLASRQSAARGLLARKMQEWHGVLDPCPS